MGGEKRGLMVSLFSSGIKDSEETVVQQFQFLPPGVPIDIVQLGFRGSRGSVWGRPAACAGAKEHEGNR